MQKIHSRRRRALGTAWCAAVCLLATIVCASPAAAATYTVTKTADTNDGVCNSDCSLREAIIAANADPGSTVELGSGLTYTLALGPADAPEALVAGSGDLDITAPVLIEGHGSTINGGAIDRVLHIQGAFGAIVNELTITGGVASGFLSLGGGIYVRNAQVTLNSSTVTGNATALETGARDDGGGIAALGTYVPGGASTRALLRLINSTVSNNTGLNGGGIVCVLCVVTATGTTISGNSGEGLDGGGIDVVGHTSSVDMTGSALTGNIAFPGGSRGGGLSAPVGASTVTITLSRIVNNASTTGSALFNGAATMEAANNWWGCNAGAGAVGGTGGCGAGTANGVSGAVTVQPRLILTGSVAPTFAPVNTSAVVTADLTSNSAGAVPAGGHVPDGTMALFQATTLGNFVTQFTPTVSGKATNTFLVGNTEGVPNITVSIDGQSVAVTLLIVRLPTVTVAPVSQTIDPGQTVSLSVTATGTPTLQYQWYEGSPPNIDRPVGVNSNAFTSPALSGGTRYWVRVSNPYGFTNSTAAIISMRFTDATLTVGVSLIRVIHIEELRTRVNLLRGRYALSPVAWTDPTLTAQGTTIRAAHISELRTGLDQVYAAASLPAPSWTDPVLTTGVTPIKRQHIAELRVVVAAVE